MSIVTTDLLFYDSANVPTDDVTTTGGAIATTGRPVFDLFSANAKLAMVSDGADVRTVTIVGRLASGVVATESGVALNGATEVLSTNTFERILSVTLSATDGARTVSFKQGTGGTVRATIPPTETKRHISFQKSTSETSTATRYEKVFGKNTNGTNALLAALVTLTADPASKIKIGLATAVDDTVTVTNRKTAPASVSFVDDGVAQGVPGTDLAAGSAIGIWVQQTLGANDTPVRNTYTLQLSGSTT